MVLTIGDMGDSFSCLLFLPNGLLFWKKPLFFSFSAGIDCIGPSLAEDMADPLNCFVGELWPLDGSKLEKDVGFE